jgi:hypothetical protein
MSAHARHPHPPRRPRRARHRRRVGPVGVAVAAVLLAGCTTPASPAAPRAALRALLADLAAGDVAGACRAVTPTAVADLARAFDGSTCAQTLSAATGYIRVRSGEQAAVAGASVLPTVDIPLSPAPFRAGSTTTTLRVSYRDPVLGEQQELDVGLRLDGDVWRVDSGIAALFTLLS